MPEMSKERYRSLQKSWKEFDRSTAYGCAARGVPYDPIKCAQLLFEHLKNVDRDDS